MILEPDQIQCHVCQRFRGGDLTCDAYPEGIPPELYGGVSVEDGGEVDHRLAFPGDRGVRFVPLPGKRHPLEVLQGTR